MAKSIDPVQRLIDWLKRLERRVKSLETAPTLQNSSVTKGRLHFIGGELLIDAGGTLTVNGTLEVNGTTTITGTFRMTGSVDMEGNVTITGPLTVEGVWDLTGNGTIAGDVELTGNMTIADGGTFNAGGITISEEGGGLIESLIQILVRTPLWRVEGGLRVEQGAIFDGDITANSLIPIASSAAGGAVPGSVVIDGANRFRRVIAG